MNLFKIYQQALSLVKNNRWLWVLGLILVSFTGGGFNFTYFFQLEDFLPVKTPPVDFYQANYNPVLDYVKSLFFSIPPSLYLIWGGFVILALFLSLVLNFIIGSWAYGATIGALNAVYDQKKINLQKAAFYGLRSWQHILWLRLVPWFLYFLILVLVGGLLFVSYVVLIDTFLRYFVVLLMVVLFLLGFLAGLAMVMIQIWAKRIAVIENKNGWDSFKAGWQLVKKHFFSMLFLGTANCFLSCLSMIFWLGIVGVSLGGGFFLFFLNKQLGLVFGGFAILAILSLILLSSLIFGIYKIFNYATWNILYRQIKEGKVNE